ncbi:protein kinase domain-containing protein [Verticillium alfalfae VaMs.102]|uniref:Protein kinase domain-containing protein n=1 Tax=Verticillium alfalfae (strain VaMs.102 / ATCC MYA-4576 / FGSC 10136) TaxID=526221 RepID=C9SBV5_VERA1|nr:protein kinase domain-containing protein [Verticillium alfalfae VaMs.102]EEY15839.1 protein kinase domain-containing protein [Verticillium alfalfae VaMs.102]
MAVGDFRESTSNNVGTVQVYHSTLWLARDEQLSKYVALKVATADHNSKEIDLLSQLSALADENAQDPRNFIPLILDRFNLDGPNGTHPCYVTAPARCNLAEALDPGCGPFPLRVARSLATQLAMAVTVDGQPLPPGVPPHVYPPIWLGKPGDEVTLPEAKLVLADFGTAFCPAQESRFEFYTPLQIRRPQARFEPITPLSYASDIWSLGCVIWGILGVRPFLDNWHIWAR